MAWGIARLSDRKLTFLQDFLRERTPKVKLVRPEGTYLAWLDCRELGLGAKELDEMILHKAKLWLDGGTMFGAGGGGFQRINVACPRTILKEALERLEKAVSQR